MSPSRKPVVLVTGTSRGIGLAVAKILIEQLGARVVGLSRTPTSLNSEDFLSILCDITDDLAVTAAIAQTQTTFGHLDGLVVNAATLGPLCRIGDDTPLSEWKTHFDINFFSLITIVRAALPGLRASELGGRIIFVSSGAAVNGTAGGGPYSTSKAAMNSLCRTLAEEEPDIVSVAVRPGAVDTDMQLKIRESGGQSMGAASHAGYLRLHADGQLLQPSLPGLSIATLAIKAATALSGEFLNWNDERVVYYL